MNKLISILIISFYLLSLVSAFKLSDIPGLGKKPVIEPTPTPTAPVINTTLQENLEKSKLNDFEIQKHFGKIPANQTYEEYQSSLEKAPVNVSQAVSNINPFVVIIVLLILAFIVWWTTRNTRASDL